MLRPKGFIMRFITLYIFYRHRPTLHPREKGKHYKPSYDLFNIFNYGDKSKHSMFNILNRKTR